MAVTRDQQGERTEMPTPFRLAEARRVGHVARSFDLVSVAVVAAGLAAIGLFGNGLVRSLVGMTCSMLGPAAGDPRRPGGTLLATWTGAGAPAAIWPVCRAALPILVLPVVAAVAANVAQTGLVFTWTPIKPDLRRISPSAGLRLVFSSRAFVRSTLGVTKIAVAAAVLAWAVPPVIWQACGLSAGDPATMLTGCGAIVLGASFRLLAAMAVLALVDFLYQHWQYRRDLRTTRRELLDDLRQMEGAAKTFRGRRRLELLARRRRRPGGAAGGEARG